MISIYTESGQELQLKKGSIFTINWISTAFNDDGDFLGSYSYPVGLAYCPANNKALGMGNQLENRSGRQDMTVNVRIFGIHWKKCTLSFTIDIDSYSAYLKIDNGVFANILSNTLLTDIFVNVDANKTFLSYQYLQVTNSLAETNTYMANMKVDTTGHYPCYFFPVLNPGLLGSYNGETGTGVTPVYDDNYLTVNPYTAGIGFAVDIADEPARSCYYTPFFNLIYVTKQVLNFLGYAPGGDFFQDPLILDKVIYNTGVFNSLDIFASTGLKLSLAQHLPNISISDFLKFLRTNFKLAIYFDPDLAICTISIIKNTLQSRNRIDISGYVNPNYSIKSNTPDGYELVQPIDSGDSLYQALSYGKSYYIGNTEDPTSVSNFIATLYMKTGQPSPFNNNVLFATYRLPQANQLGNAYSTIYGESGAYNLDVYNANAFEFRLLTYRGMQPDSHGHLYPYGSSDDLNSTGAVSDYGLSLGLGGVKGILAVYNKDYYNFFLRTELVELDVFLPMRVLQQVTPTGLLQFRTPSQAIIPAMLNDMTFEASQNEERLESKMRVYPIYSQRDVDVPLIETFVVTQVINPGGLYVKFTLTEDPTQTTYVNYNGQRVKANIFCIATLSFFEDAAATIPKSAPLTAVYMHTRSEYNNDSSRIISQTAFTENASGFVYTSANVYQTQQLISDFIWEVVTNIYNIAVDPKVIAGVPYTVIGNIYGAN